jgi:hypothetical protein
MENCKTCSHFERGQWAKELNNSKSEPQCGGHCELLMQVLKMDGNVHYTKEKIYIQDTFGCVLHKTK